MNRKTLVALDEGGVPDSVIDLMVALTYPKRSSSSARRRPRADRRLHRHGLVRSVHVAE